MIKSPKKKALILFGVGLLILLIVMGSILVFAGSFYVRLRHKEGSIQEAERIKEVIFHLKQQEEDIVSYIEDANLIRNGTIWLIDQDQEVFAGEGLFPEEAAREALDGEVFFQTETFLEGGVYHTVTAVPVIEDNLIQGALVTAVPGRAFYDLTEWLVKMAVVSITVFAAVAAVLHFWAMEEHSRSFKDLADKVFAAGTGKSVHWPEQNRDDLGKLVNALTYLQEYHQREETKLSSEKDRLEKLLDKIKTGVFLVNEQGRVQQINPAARDMLGVENGRGQGEPILEIIKDYDLKQKIETALEKKEEMTYEIKIILPTERILETHVTPLETENKTPSSVVMVVLQDITAFQKLAQMRSDFVANVSHELRTPLTSIRGFAETIIEEGFEDEKSAKHFINIIKQEADRLTRLIDDLLDLSRIESGEVRMSYKKTNLNNLISETLEKLHSQLDKASIELHVDMPKETILLTADPDRISQVLINFIDNSMKYTHRNGKIWVRVKEEEQTVQVEVEDNGVGIPSQDLDRIFERFYRVDKARTRRSGGTGLGLAIVKHIVEAHGGRVFVNSTPGKGTTFGFLLPKD